MNNLVTIKTNNDQRSELKVHPEKAAALGLTARKFAYLSFGNRKHYVKISLDREIAPENLLLSQNIITALHLPDYPLYEVRVNQNAIVIGPYIGLLISNEDRRLRTSLLNKLLVYVKDYARLHGAILIFALDKVDREKRLIEGFCYNPVIKCWQRGIFPYPAAIYRTIGLSAEWKNHLLAEIGDKIFNNPFFGKWQMYQWFSAEPEINPHLPYTELYQSPQDVLKMLGRFPKLYLKPVLGLQGRGIVRISLADKGLSFQYRDAGTNRVLAFADSGQALEDMQKRFRPGRYLIQAAVDLLEYKGGLIDFRCVVQKNQSNEWICQAIIGRSGVKDSIVSNISSGGAAFTVREYFKEGPYGIRG